MRQTIRRTEYRFMVPGPPVSFRSPKAKAYKAKIRGIAKTLFDGPATREVEVRLDYFHRGRRPFDMDNVAKCVLDALTGIAYGDDQQVRLQVATGHRYDRAVSLAGVPVDIIKPLREHPEYLFVRIRH